MTDTLAPMERTNWALSAWNSTLDQNDVPSAWLYGQDHLCMGNWSPCVFTWGGFSSSLPPPRPPPHNTGLKLMHIFEKII